MTFEEIQDIFFAGDFINCIRQGEDYLVDKPDDTEVLLLLASVYYFLDLPEELPTLISTVDNFSIPYTERAIIAEPENTEALHSYLNYSINNLNRRLLVGESIDGILSENMEKYIGYADRLIAIPTTTHLGYLQKIRLYNLIGDKEYELDTIEKALVFLVNKNDIIRSEGDANYSDFFYRKIELLRSYESFDSKELANIIELGFERFASEVDEQYVTFLNISEECNDINLSLRILEKLIDVNSNDDDIINEFVKWHKKISNHIDKGLQHHYANYFLLIIERNYFDYMNIDGAYYYHHALSILENDKHDYAANHFAGTYLFEQEDYSQALLYLENAIKNSPKAVTTKRYIESYLYLNHHIPTIPILDDIPIQMYNAGTELYQLSTEIGVDDLRMELLEAARNILSQAQEAFYNYFVNDEYPSYPTIWPHQWAMNANNLAIIYNQFEDYTTAADIASEGLKQSSFWELYSTLIEALIANENYDAAKVALDQFFYEYSRVNNIPFNKYLVFLTDRITVDFHLDPKIEVFEDAKILLNQIYDYAAANPEMSEYDYRDLEAAKTSVQSICYNFIENEPESVKIELYNNLAEKYPNESNPPFMLMQSYMILGEYSKSAEAGYKYLANKPEFVLDNFDKVRTIHYILKGHVLSGEYEKALIIYQSNYRMVREELADSDYCTWLSNAIKLHIELEYYDVVDQLISEYKDIYATNEWSYDEDLEQIFLYDALALYNQNQLKEAHKILDNILSKSPHLPLADEYKRNWNKPSFLSRFGL